MHINVQNTTQCELTQTPHNVNDIHFQCNRFYKYITFPNLFGHRSQTEAFQILQTFQTALVKMDRVCHKHLDFLCVRDLYQVVLMEPMKTMHSFTCKCEQMCLEAVAPLSNFIDCSYYRKSSDIPCTYQPVTCDSPPSIPNGHMMDENHNEIYPVGSIVEYSCDNDYKVQGNNTSICQYWGSWSSTNCNSNKHIKYIIISATSIVAITSIIAIGSYTYKRNQQKKRKEKYFENQPLQKRNREYDAFVSYTYQASIDFVKNRIYPGLLHQILLLNSFSTPDFHAATLIYQNIVDGVRKSQLCNCTHVPGIHRYTLV